MSANHTIGTLLMNGIVVGLPIALIVVLFRKWKRVRRKMANPSVVRKNMHRLELPKYDRPIRYICTCCGGWWDGDANRLIVAGFTGYDPDDPNLQITISAQQIEMTPIDRHMKMCHARIRTIKPDSPEWETLDPNKREN